ncbi:MAG TPA: hypothetical protein VKV35_10450 [Streptosporangiaceae bacterium]|nr:hypothetical protein [Streptosporangiaceae bacterium]
MTAYMVRPLAGSPGSRSATSLRRPRRMIRASMTTMTMSTRTSGET